MLDVHWSGLVIIALIAFVLGYYTGGGARR